MTTQQEFKRQKEQGEAKLNNLQGFLEKGRDFELFGVSVDSGLEKLQKAKEKINQRKLKVVLVGGFSEGKTSIASAWLGEVLGKIDSAESSNEVLVYDTKDNEVEIVDTPGLFGFKEKGMGVNAEKYKDITKKFVSEADIILYVMNPTNPIKESHKDDLEWLFRTLNLLPRTIFVLSKFDEVADMSDDREFEQSFTIKKEKHIIPNLQDAINLNQSEKSDLQIVAVSANPFGKGLESWLANKDEFEKLSHIDSLQNATTECIKRNGGLESILVESQQSILSDIVGRQLPSAISLQGKIKGDMQRLNESAKALQKDMLRTNDKMNDAQIALRGFVTEYFNDLIKQVNGTSLETFGDFMQGEIGSEGSLISAKIQNEFQRHTHSVINDLRTSIERFDAEKGDFEKAISSYGKQGVEWLQKSGAINSQNVLAARDLLKTGLEKIGINVGTALNFKPWGAVNLAKGANTALAGVGLALEVWDSYKQHEKEQEFQKAKSKIANMLETQMKEILDTINSDKFYELFSGYNELKNALESTQNELESFETQSQKFDEWVKEGEIIEAEIVEN
ncbi:LeoA/HP0731 family dynamin-like GTPase [Helicobacter sp. 23-1046]